MILLDTNICVAAMRNDRRVSAKLMQYGGRCHVPWVVAAELRYGVEKLALTGADADPIRARVERFLLIVGGIVMVTDAALHVYASIRASLESDGTLIGSNDLWIASLAVAENALLITDNLREFKRVPELRVENWIVR